MYLPNGLAMGWATRPLRSPCVQCSPKRLRFPQLTRKRNVDVLQNRDSSDPSVRDCDLVKVQREKGPGLLARASPCYWRHKEIYSVDVHAAKVNVKRFDGDCPCML